MNVQKESNCDAEEDLVCSDFVRPVVTRRMNALATPAVVLMNTSDNNLNKPTAGHTMGRNCNDCIQTLMQQPNSLSDELQYRDCLTKALTMMCKEITDYTVIDCYELDFLISENCIAGDDKAYVDTKSIGTMQRTRRLLSLMLLRDYKTLLTYLASLLIQNTHVVEKVLREFDKYLRNNYRKQQKCTFCHLESRVDLSLFADDLLSYDENWLPFYNKVCQTECVGPDKAVWREFTHSVRADEEHGYISDIVLKALQACGYHSDIVMMLQNDRQMKRNSFVCRCSEIPHFAEDRWNLSSAQTRTSSRQMSRAEQSHINDKRSMTLQRTCNQDNNSKKTGHQDENINKEGVEKKLFYGTEGRELHTLLKGNEDASKTDTLVRRRVKDVSKEDKRANIESSNIKDSVHETEVLKLHTHTREHKMETLKGNGYSEESTHVKVLTRTTPTPSASGIPSIQMDLLKVDIFQIDEQEKQAKRDISLTTLQRSERSDASESWKNSRAIYPKKGPNCDCCQHQLEQLKTSLPEIEKDTVSGNCEHQMTLLKLGIEEFDNGDNRLSSFESFKSIEETSYTIKRSFNGAQPTNLKNEKVKQNMCQNSGDEELETGHILNVLIAFTFFICFLQYVLQSFLNLF